MRNWNKLYQTYKKTYMRKAAKSEVELEPLYNKSSFKYIYEALEADKLKEVKAGTRKVLNTTQDLVNRQVQYLYSKEEAKRIQYAAAEQYGQVVSLKKIRSGEYDVSEFWEDVSEYSKNRGPNDKTVGQVFFGSPE